MTLLLLRQTPDLPPNLLFGGSGTSDLSGVEVTMGVATSGSGSSTTTLGDYASTAMATGSGQSTTVGQRVVNPEMRISLLEDTVSQAPTAIQVMLMDGFANTAVTFQIDGTSVYTTTLDAEGNLEPTSIPVDEAVGAMGTHSLVAVQAGSQSASVTFTVQRNPALSPIVRGPDLAPVLIPGSGGKWVLQDLLPGGLGSYVMPHGPSSMSHPHVEKQLSAMHTTATSGQFHVYQAGPAPQPWQLVGYTSTQAMTDKLAAYAALNRRFYIIDHRGRAWKVTVEHVELVPRLRHLVNDVLTDWGHDYVMRVLVYDQVWITP